MKQKRKSLILAAVCVVLMLTTAVAVFAGGQTEPPKPEQAAQPAAPPKGKYGEAPMLSQRVAAGTLAKVDERLPAEPLVMPVVDQIGRYGGTWHRAFFGTGETRPLETVSHEPLIWRRNADDLSVAPNIAKSWEWSADGTTVTFHLREGMKWSDGEPFTSEDIRFWWEDIILYQVSPDKAPAIPKWLMMEETRPKFAFVDDYTFSITFPIHHALFLEIATESSADMIVPAHYAKQFHPKYVEPAKHGLKTKEELYNLMWDKAGDVDNRYWNPERPVLEPWVTVKWDVGKTHVMERNPYYWKVDPEGNQLPYIDRIEHALVENVEVLNLQVVTGKIDMQIDHLSFDNYSLFAENEGRGDYRVMYWKTDRTAVPVISMNFNNPDPVLKELIWTKDFRRALSYAINRQEINEKVWFGRARPMSPCIDASTQWFTKGLDELHIAYDPKLSNELLDKIGLTKRDSDGFRLRKDGKRLSLRVSQQWPPPWPEHVPTMDLIREYFAAIGVELILDPVQSSLHNMRQNNAEFDLATHNRGGTIAPWAMPHFWAPIALTSDRWAPLYARHYLTDGKEGEPPVGMFKEALDEYLAIRVEQNDAKRDEMIKKLVRRPIEEIWYLGTVGETPDLIIKKNNFMNVPEKAVVSWRLRVEGITHPEQYFIKQ